MMVLGVERKGLDFLPTCMDYSRYLDLAVGHLGLTRNEARDRYGNFTYREWEGLFNREGTRHENVAG